MQQSQEGKKQVFYSIASRRQRFIAGAVAAGILAFFAFLWLGAEGKIDTSRLFTPCGFKQKYNLPCPTCGMTTAAKAFARGRIFEAWDIQPAGAFLCTLLALAGFFALLIAFFGVYFNFLRRFLNEVKVSYILVALLIIIVFGWAVTLVRAL